MPNAVRNWISYACNVMRSDSPRRRAKLLSTRAGPTDIFVDFEGFWDHASNFEPGGKGELIEWEYGRSEFE